MKKNTVENLLFLSLFILYLIFYFYFKTEITIITILLVTIGIGRISEDIIKSIYKNDYEKENS